MYVGLEVLEMYKKCIEAIDTMPIHMKTNIEEDRLEIHLGGEMIYMTNDVNELFAFIRGFEEGMSYIEDNDG